MAGILRVLLACDDSELRKAATKSLPNLRVRIGQQNEEVLIAMEEVTQISECRALCQSAQRPDILLLDDRLLHTAGIDFLGQVAGAGSDILPVILTVDKTLPASIFASKKEPYDFLVKPFSPDELRLCVHKAAERLFLRRRAEHLPDEKWSMVFDFISLVSHELKAPLAAIEGYLQIIIDQTAGDNPQLYRQMLDRSLIRSQRMRKLINNLLDLSGIKSGRKKRELAEVDLVEAARHSIEMLWPEARFRKIAVNLHAPSDLILEADPGELDIIFNNLISNAIKYNNEGGRVDVRLENKDDTITIAVSDTGIGIKEEDIPKLFREFVRIKNEKTRDIMGSGLGLYILKKFVELYHGSIDVKSTYGEGSTFTVRLPQ